MACSPSELQEASIDTDKLSYEIFSILESKFLFGYDDQKLWNPKPIADRNPNIQQPQIPISVSDDDAAAMKNQRGKICILSIDGGGMRGILSGKALAYLEQALKTKSGNPDARIADYFDVAAGTGIGGIFTAMLFGTKDQRRPIFEAEDTWKLLAHQGNPSSGKLVRRILNRRASGTAALEKAVKEAFTEKNRPLTLKDTLKPVLIPCYDLSTTAPFLFSRADALQTDSFDFKLWEVCRATSAEPGVFEPVQIRSVDGRTICIAVDGGVAMSNPTAAAITHVLHNKHEFPLVRGVEDLLVLSLGSGEVVEYEHVKTWKVKQWARISCDAASDMVDQSVGMAFGQSSDYVRIQGTMVGDVDSDVKKLIGVAEEMLKQKNVESVLFGGKRIGEQRNMEKLEWFAGELVEEHRRRSCTIP